MTQHLFIFQPGLWVGEGKIQFSSSPEQIKFYTKWDIPSKQEEELLGTRKISCTQKVEMSGDTEQMTNRFTFAHVTPSGFTLKLENDLVGHVEGQGVIDGKTIAWEFRGHPNFEGFEVYELLDSGDYMLHAEYSSPDQFRTIIDGRIWKKVAT
jgi:hypothetical protein